MNKYTINESPIEYIQNMFSYAGIYEDVIKIEQAMNPDTFNYVYKIITNKHKFIIKSLPTSFKKFSREEVKEIIDLGLIKEEI